MGSAEARRVVEDEMKSQLPSFHLSIMVYRAC